MLGQSTILYKLDNLRLLESRLDDIDTKFVQVH